MHPNKEQDGVLVAINIYASIEQAGVAVLFETRIREVVGSHVFSPE
jgi:hypothetical protein